LGLQRRHEALVEQVRQLHWDLGGLAYEMAIRDHFRLDVLVRRAALLQERDIELAQVERLMEQNGERAAAACHQCSVPHSPRAVYCWQCGVRLSEPASEAPTEPRSALAEPAAANVALVASPLSSPRASATLVLVLLAFGTILGGVAGQRAGGALAASRAPERLLLPVAPTAAEAPPAATASATPETPAAESRPSPTSSQTPAASAAKEPAGPGGSEQESAKRGASERYAVAAPKLQAVKHVFVIVLSEASYASLFGATSTLPYLARTLAAKGELIPRYYSVSHGDLAGEIALLSGQGPTPQTQQDCPTFADLAPGTIGAEGQARGEGCVYPPSVPTLMDQMRAKHLPWRAYIQGLEEAPAHTEACAHPALGQTDPAQAQAAGAYATYRNPFVYFHSLIDTPACQALDVGLRNLAGDLASPRGAPAFAYIAPDRCHDASPVPCAPGAAAGPGPAEAFLEHVVPQILASASYREDGLLAITAAQAPASGEPADSSGCCGQPRFPNLPQSAAEEAAPAPSAPPGGGQVGVLLLSPLVKPGSVVQDPADSFALLRFFEDELGLPRLGYAGSSRLTPLEPSSILSASG
jgi:hypothetical protein